MKGNLCIKIALACVYCRTTYGDHERCRLNYFATYKNLYLQVMGACEMKKDFTGSPEEWMMY